VTAAAIAAQVVDIQNDRQHKGFIKVTLHVPSERGAMLTESLGWPTYTDPVPVAIARLDPNKIAVVAASEAEKVATPHDPSASHRLTTRAVMLAKDPQFHLFLQGLSKLGCITEEDAAVYIRTKCGVASRSEIKPGTAAATKLDFIESAFICWRDKEKYIQAAE
jgi:hypothetical protein